MELKVRLMILQKAKEYRIKSDLLKAVVLVESSGNQWAMRAEPGYPWLFEVNRLSNEIGCNRDTMKVMQSTSWGLMQIMGAVAYEYGFNGWCSELCKPDINLDYGCKHLKAKITKYGPNPADIYAAYNAGSVRKMDNKTYVNQRAVNHFLRIYDNVKLESTLRE